MASLLIIRCANLMAECGSQKSTMKLNAPTTNNYAFPGFEQETHNGPGNCKRNPGLSKLEYFAAAALQGLLSNPNYMDKVNQDTPASQRMKQVADDASIYAHLLDAKLTPIEEIFDDL